MNKSGCVCIVIPTYNGAAFLPEALESVAQQTYTDREVVISDDGSTDQTLAILKEFQQKVSFPVHILEHDRLGMVENWNYSIQFVQRQLPKVKYLKFLFQDDILVPKNLEVMIAVADQKPTIGMAFSQRFLIGEVPESLTWLHHISQCWQHIKPIQAGIEFFHTPFFLHPPDNKIGEPSNVLLAMEVFDRVGYFDPTFRQFCDLEMWLRIMSHYDIAYIDRQLSGFRVHPQQATWHNDRADRVWTEIYGVWYKMLTHPVYENVPRSVKARIFGHVCQELGRECLRIVRHRKGHRLPQVLSWLSKFICAFYFCTLIFLPSFAM